MKTAVYEACVHLLHERINELKKSLDDLVEGAKADSKSTAGDKHETARAMMQLEQEKLSDQLNILLQQERTLQWIDPEIKSERVVNGSLVKTNRGIIFIGVALGKIFAEGHEIICVSSQSPLGLKLIAAVKGESRELNGVIYRIEDLL